MEDGDKSWVRGSVKKSPLEAAEENTGEILHTVEVLFEPDAVMEIRAFKGRETVSGYFDDHDVLARKASELDKQGYAVYVALNEVDPELLARSANRVRKVYRDPLTADGNIVRRRWLPLDFDSARPSGVSATDEEKKAAQLRALEVRDYLREQGWPEPVVGDSGNGYHLLYPVDLPNDREALELVGGVLEALAFKFSDDIVDLDTSVHNAARIWKLYGTTAHKGDDTPSRPHRRSALLKVPDAVQIVDRDQLEGVSRSKPSPPPREERRFDPKRNGRRDFNLDAWIGERNVHVKREGPWGRDGYRWVLEECPWNGHTDNAAYIVRFAGGAIAAGCHHNGCQGYGWRDLREHYEPGAYDERNGLQAEDRLQECSGPVATLLSEVEPERVEWLWPGRIPLGKLTVLDGDPGLGKSAMTLDIAARISAGLELPDGERCEPAGVLLMSAEDGLADTIRPRLDAAGADTKRILALTTKIDPQGTEQMVSIPEDLPLIEHELKHIGARLMVVDPLMAFLSGDTNSHKDQDVRRALAPLAKLAERTGAAVLIVRHLNKASGGNTLYRGGGSIGIIGAARSGLVVAEDPEDPERRILAHNKQNLCKPAASLVFSVETASNGAARIAWRGQSELNASQILRAPVDEEEKSALSEAKEFLLDELKDGPMAAKQVKKNARDADISERTLKRAKAELRVRSDKEGDGSWTWSLPPKEAKGGQPSTVGPDGPLGPLDKDGPLERENLAYLSEEGQGGQGGQGLEIGNGWPPWQKENPEHPRVCLCDECLPV